MPLGAVSAGVCPLVMRARAGARGAGKRAPIAPGAETARSRLDRPATIGLNPAASEGIHVRP